MATKKQEYLIVEQSFIEANRSCTVPWVLDYDEVLPHTSLHLRQIFEILGGVSAIINISIALYLLRGHYFHWTTPREQRQYARIIWFLIVQSLVEWFSIYFYDASGSIRPGGDYYESFAIMALLLLYIHFLSPGNNNDDEPAQDVCHRVTVQNIPPEKQARIHRFWIYVFQLIATRIITVVANEVLYNTTCPLSKARIRGGIAIETIQSTATGFATFGVIAFERQMKNQLIGRRATLKLFSFKMVIGLSALQDIIFSALTETKAFVPSTPYHIGYNDFAKGLPALILLWELTIVSVIFLWSFSAKPYRDQARSGAPIQSGPFMAFLQTLSPIDFWQAFAFTVRGRWPSNQLMGQKHYYSEAPQDDDNKRYVNGDLPPALGGGIANV